MQLTEHFFHTNYHSNPKKWNFSKGLLLVNLSIRQVTASDAFTFLEEIVKRNTSLFLGVGFF